MLAGAGGQALAGCGTQAPGRMLSARELAHFHEKGWLIVRGVADATALRRLDCETAGLHERMADANAGGAPAGGRGVDYSVVRVSWEDQQAADRPRRIRQLMNSEMVCPTIEQLLQSERMVGIVSALMGGTPQVALFHSKLLMKAACDGSFTPFHQDWGYWHPAFKQPTHINCMLAIDPMTTENGCIRFVNQSHKLGPREHTKLDSASFSLALDASPSAFPQAIPVECDAGDAVFFGPLVIHGSHQNHSTCDRRANTFAFDLPGNLISARGSENEGYRIRVLPWRPAAPRL